MRPVRRAASPRGQNSEFPSSPACTLRGPKPHPPRAFFRTCYSGQSPRSRPSMSFIGCCGHETNARANQWKWPTASLTPGSRRGRKNPEMRGADQCRKPIRQDDDGGPTNGESPKAGPEVGDGKGPGSRRRGACECGEDGHRVWQLCAVRRGRTRGSPKKRTGEGATRQRGQGRGSERGVSPE